MSHDLVARASGGILAMALFALSCFGLLLFFWLSFGGPVAAQAQGLPVQGRVPRGDATRPRGGRARRRREHRQGAGEDDRHGPPTARSRRSRSTPATRRSPRTPARSCARRRCSARRSSSSRRAMRAPRARSPDGGMLADSRVKGTVNSTRSSMRSTRGHGPRSRAGSRRRRRRSAAIARISTTPSGRCPRSPTTAPTCCGSSTARSSRRRR